MITTQPDNDRQIAAVAQLARTVLADIETLAAWVRAMDALLLDTHDSTSLTPAQLVLSAQQVCSLLAAQQRVTESHQRTIEDILHSVEVSCWTAT